MFRNINYIAKNRNEISLTGSSYAGIDEAISLWTLGLDFIRLWHIYVLPLRIWRKYRRKYGRNFLKGLGMMLTIGQELMARSFLPAQTRKFLKKKRKEKARQNLKGNVRVF